MDHIAGAKQLEELASNAWPSLQTVCVDGWIARLSQGYTKRANSVTPLYPCRGQLADNLQRCERLYQGAGLPLLFRLPSFVPETTALDAYLAARGFAWLDESCVLRLKLKQVSPCWLSRAHVASAEDDIDAWVHRYHVLSGSSPHPVHHRILSLIKGHRCLLTLMHDGVAVACGLGVLAGGHLGLFDIVTDAACRRRGFGRLVTESLLAWGQERGATQAYLQVVAANTAARRLYAELGFEEVYRYGYRLAPDSSKTLDSDQEPT